MKNKKLNLKTLEVQSFITKIGAEAKTVAGGEDVPKNSYGYWVSDCWPKAPKLTVNDTYTVDTHIGLPP